MSLETLQCGPTTNGITLRISILETKEIMFYRPSRRKQQVVSAPFWHTEQVSEESPTFHSRVLLFPEVKSPQRELSFHGTFIPWNFRSHRVKVPSRKCSTGMKVLSGLFAPRNGSAREQKVLILFRMYIAQYAHLIIVIC